MTVAEILKQAGEGEELVLREHATLLALSKMSRYEAECAAFEAKYNVSFEVFHKRLEEMKNQEDFEADDDLMDWQFAYRALRWWKQKLHEIRCAG